MRGRRGIAGDRTRQPICPGAGVDAPQEAGDAETMDAADLRALQAPLKQKYRDDPETARTPMRARADFSDPGITTTVQTWGGPIRAGFHPATGGDGSDACTADMLLQALLGCTGVTLRSVATAMGIEIRGARLAADASLWVAWSARPRSGSRRGPGCSSAARSRAAWAASGSARRAHSTRRTRR